MSAKEKAHQCWDQGKLRQAFNLFMECAASGDPSCMLNLGYFHDVGVGTSKNKAEAMRWYKRAYRLGDSAAASNIAILYRERQNHRLEFGWFVRAAMMGDGDAEVDAAKLLLAGRGVRKSKVRALACLKRAIKSDHITEAGKEEAVQLLHSVESGGRHA